MGTFTPDLLTGSRHSSKQKSAQFLSESCKMKDKTTSLFFKAQRTCLDIEFEPGKILVMLGTMCVSHDVLSIPFSFAINSCLSNSENMCAVNSLINRL